MQLFFRVTLIYAIVAIALTFVLRDDAANAFNNLFGSILNLREHLSSGSWVVLLLIGFAWWVSPSSKEFVHRLSQTVLGLALCCVFMASFSSMKSLLPLLADALTIPRFFADPALARFDAALHLGTDPWILAHAVTNAIGFDTFIHRSTLFYSLFWIPPAMYLPAFVLLFGATVEKRRHFILLYVLSWILLGNVAALAGFSAGPVYYDRIFGTERFVELSQALAVAGLEQSWFGAIQGMLWTSYVETEQNAGAGISAFPSLHVAMMTVTALYLASFGRIGKWIGVVLVVAVLFISVWIGFHYAIDGYASIAAVLAMHWALSRRHEAPVDRDATSVMAPGE